MVRVPDFRVQVPENLCQTSVSSFSFGLKIRVQVQVIIKDLKKPEKLNGTFCSIEASYKMASIDAIFYMIFSFLI